MSGCPFRVRMGVKITLLVPEKHCQPTIYDYERVTEVGEGQTSPE